MRAHYHLPTRELEHRLHQQGYRLVAGVDEVGRGPLAGPVVAAAVVLPETLDGSWLGRVRDSKTLSPAARERLAPLIRGCALGAGVGEIWPEEIDSVGIVEATRRAMALALDALPVAPDCLLVDALALEWRGIPCHSLIKGDSRFFSIAAASIVAKVHRDKLMATLDTSYPGYGFARHKGYGTAEHLAALRRLGPCPLHRRSFAPVRDWAEDPDRRPRLSSRSSLGNRGEQAAEGYLRSHGYAILQRNYRSPWGEVDLVAQDGPCVVFVEVRTRRSRAFGLPEESITRAKAQRLVATSATYLQEHGLEGGPWRIDLMAVDMDGSELRLRHLPHVVGGP